MQAYINFNGLPSWLALLPLKRIAAETGVVIDWQPMLGNLGNVAGSNVKAGEQDPLADYKARRARARSKAKAREQERMCEMLGLDAELGGRSIDPVWLSLGLLWVKESAEVSQQWRYVEMAFEQTYRAAAEVESPQGLIDLLMLAGVDSEGFLQFSEAQRELLEASREVVLEKSVLNAPAFILDDEVFNGREHLPLIEWKLKGCHGTPPA